MMITRGKSSFLTTFECGCFFYAIWISLGWRFGHLCDEYLSVRLTFVFVHMHLEGVCLIICVRVTYVYAGFVCFSAFFGHD
jgi:hypothetical protein